MSTPLAEKSTKADERQDGPGIRQRRRIDFRPSLLRVTILLGFFLVWEVAAQTELINPIFAPPPSAILTAAVDIIGDEQVADAFQVTGYEVLTAFLIAVAFGLSIGMLLGLVRPLREAYFGPILFLLSTPKSIFLPIFLLLFGIGTTAKIAFGAFSAFFYIVTNVVGGVGLLEERHKRLAHAFKAPLRHYLTDIVMPSALPGIFAGLWFGIRQTIIGVLIAELFASDAGVGYLIKIYTNQFRTDRTLAVVLMLSLLAIIAGSLWTRLEDRLQRWRTDAHT